MAIGKEKFVRMAINVIQEKSESKGDHLETALRNAILNAKIAKSGNKALLIHHLNDLRLLSFNSLEDNDGHFYFEASAEFHFVPKEGVSFSSGNRPVFCGQAKVMGKDGVTFELVDALCIRDFINTNNLKTLEDEQSNL